MILRTRLWRWIVYSRATTSEMAERVVVGFLEAGLAEAPLGGMVAVDFQEGVVAGGR